MPRGGRVVGYFGAPVGLLGVALVTLAFRRIFAASWVTLARRSVTWTFFRLTWRFVG